MNTSICQATATPKAISTVTVTATAAYDSKIMRPRQYVHQQHDQQKQENSSSSSDNSTTYRYPTDNRSKCNTASPMDKSRKHPTCTNDLQLPSPTLHHRDQYHISPSSLKPVLVTDETSNSSSSINSSYSSDSSSNNSNDLPWHPPAIHRLRPIWKKSS